MCGIMGYVGARPAMDILVRGLRRLEYRGYDSAGVAFFLNNRIEIRKSEGKLENVEKLLSSFSELERLKHSVNCGIGHTRWATHGKPNTLNAHPHQTEHVVLVHNGIIENYQELRRSIQERGYRPRSETDSELFGFLVLEEMKKGAKLVEAVRRGFSQVQGACSVVVMSETEPGTLVGVRNGSPLVAAQDPEGGAALASDAQPLLELNRDVYFLEHGDMVVGTRKGLEFLSLESGLPVQRTPSHLDWSVEKLDKQGFGHYMLKEIHEQPVAVVETLGSLLDRGGPKPFQLIDDKWVRLLGAAKEITLIACGTSWHAALLGKYWLERWAGIPVQVELASEYRYRKPVLNPGAVVIAISQSGETADTLAVIRQMRDKRIPTLGVTNVRGSTLTREADASFVTAAGPEIGVAATKTFTAQLVFLFVVAGYLGTQRAESTAAEDRESFSKLFPDLLRLPHLMAEYLEPNAEWIKDMLKKIRELTLARGFFFIGRGYSFPIALEGALKLKEISYVHAEGYAAGELKHGPIAMIDPGMVVVVLAPKDLWRDKTVSNLEEVKARGAVILGVGDPDDREMAGLCHHWLPLPRSVRGLDESLLPFFITPVIQLLSYGIAAYKGLDVDKPRNLAKSVTVE